MMPKYQNLKIAKRELTGFLMNLDKHHPTRSIIERTLHDIEKVILTDPIIHACTPPAGYVNQKLKEIGY